MSRICVIGNSHITAMKLGWEIVGHERPDLEATFFGAPAKTIAQTAVRENTIFPASPEVEQFFLQTSGGKSQIDDTYDCYLVCGLKFSLARLLSMSDRHRTETESRDDRRPISAEFLHAVIASGLRQSLAIEIARKLRRISAAPIVVIPVPFRSDHGENHLPERFAEDAQRRQIAERFKAAAESAGEELNVEICFQPDATISEQLLTKAMYSRGSAPLGNMTDAHPDDDATHMNGEFGALVWRELFAGDNRVLAAAAKASA